MINGLVISKPNMVLFQTNIRFLGHNIEHGKIIPIQRSIEFGNKFPDIITDKTQLQRFLGSLNYIASYIKNLNNDTAILYERLKKESFSLENLDKDSIISKDCHNYKNGESCIQDNNDEFYKLESQFQNLNINVLTSDNVFDFLKLIKDPTLKANVIEEIENSNSPSTPKEYIKNNQNS